MAKELIFTDNFKKSYQNLPKSLRERFDQKLAILVANPKHPSLNIHRFQTKENVWEGYVSSKYRFTFSLTETAIIFRNIGPHGIIDKGRV